MKEEVGFLGKGTEDKIKIISNELWKTAVAGLQREGLEDRLISNVMAHFILSMSVSASNDPIAYANDLFSYTIDTMRTNNVEIKAAVENKLKSIKEKKKSEEK